MTTIEYIVNRLMSFYSRTSPGEWERDTIQDRSDNSAHEVVRGERGRVLFDAYNSEVSEIHEENGYRWDEVGRHNLDFCCECHELIPTLANLVSMKPIQSEWLDAPNCDGAWWFAKQRNSPDSFTGCESPVVCEAAFIDDELDHVEFFGTYVYWHFGNEPLVGKWKYIPAPELPE